MVGAVERGICKKKTDWKRKRKKVDKFLVENEDNGNYERERVDLRIKMEFSKRERDRVGRYI